MFSPCSNWKRSCNIASINAGILGGANIVRLHNVRDNAPNWISIESFSQSPFSSQISSLSLVSRFSFFLSPAFLSPSFSTLLRFSFLLFHLFLLFVFASHPQIEFQETYDIVVSCALGDKIDILFVLNMVSNRFVFHHTPFCPLWLCLGMNYWF